MLSDEEIRRACGDVGVCVGGGVRIRGGGVRMRGGGVRHCIRLLTYYLCPKQTFLQTRLCLLWPNAAQV